MNDSAPTRDYRALLKKALLEIQSLRTQVAKANARDAGPLAIVGIGCRFPGGITTPASFWQFLREGSDAVGPVPETRWHPDKHYGPELVSPETIHTRRGGFIEHMDRFDPAFFALSTAEAAAMDPQQRLLLEVAWEAFEHAGLPTDRIAGSRTGVYLGITNMCDFYKGLRTPPQRSGTGVSNCIAANRLSYQFDLKGPSLSLDTACSSSLVALHLACRSLRQQETDMALVAGVNLILSPDWMVTFSMAGMMSPAGLCKSFDASADGYVRSEGCAVVLVKRLADAQRDGDRILALVRGTATNQDGLSSGLTVPHGTAQQDVIRQALEDAGVSATDIGYMEAHGIGTEMGDPIEFNAVKAVLGEGRSPERVCRVGSVKANIGHAEAASGLSGLIKAILALHHGQVPPQLHFQTLNPLIELEGTPFEIPTQLTPWPTGYAHRLACVNSFGLGGTNAHVVLEASSPPESPPTENEPATDGLPLVLPLSAKSRPALRELARRYATFLTSSSPPSLADVCYTAGVGRSHFQHRLALVAHRDHPAELPDQLLTFANDDASAGTPLLHAESPCIALICGGDPKVDPGDASPPDFGHPRVMEAIRECEQAMGTTPASPAIRLFARQYGLYRLLRELGMVPRVILGHGVGEHLAAHIAGALTLTEALSLAENFHTESPPPSFIGSPPRRSWISGLHGELMPAQDPPHPTYWKRQLQEPVDPSIGLTSLAETKIDLFVVLGGREPTRDEAASPQWLHARRSGLADLLASLYMGGAPIRWQGFYAKARTRLDLPYYPFQRIRCWLDSSEITSYT